MPLYSFDRITVELDVRGIDIEAKSPAQAAKRLREMNLDELMALATDGFEARGHAPMECSDDEREATFSFDGYRWRRARTLEGR